MSTLPPHDVPAVFWIDGAGQQQGPEPLATVIERIAHDQIPPSTPVWWQGAANWAPLNSNPEATEVLNARIAPAPAPAPEPAASPFSAPAPSESAAPFNSPAAFEAPAAVFEAPAAVFEAPAAVFEAPTTTFEPPAEATSPFSAPAATTFEAPAFETPAVFVAPTATVPEVVVPEAASAPADSATYASNGSTDVFTTHVPQVTEEPEAPATVSLGDPSELEATFAELTSRAETFAADQAAAEALDPSLVAVVRQGLGDLGFTIEDSLSSDEYHSFRLTASDGSNASLAIQRVPSAPTVEAATERPLNCFVDHVGRASVGLFVGDYIGESTNQELFTKHLAAIVHAAGK